MSGTGNATQKAPDPAWGRRLVAAGPEQLAHFDAYRKRFRRYPTIAWWAGVALFVGGFAGVALATSFPGTAGLLLGLAPLPILGIIFSYGGGWFLFRFSFAAHRMWGIYENGFVAPFYVKGGWEPFVPWADVKIFKLRRMRSDDPQAIVSGELWLFRSDDPRGYHRIWESGLRDMFGYTATQLATLKEEILSIARAHLPPDKIVVETDLADN